MRKPRKKDAPEPRALALVQISAKGKTSLLPIVILIDGKFWDASAYKADPVPMALESGTVYEAERTGNTQGLFTVSAALHSNAVNSAVPWLGTGIWRPAGAETQKPETKAEVAPVGIETLAAPPRLTRDPKRVTLPPDGTPAGDSTKPSSTPPPSSPSSSSSGDEPPRLTKPPTAETASVPTAPASPQSSPQQGSAPASPAPSSTDSKPSQTGSKPDSKPADAKAANQAKVPESDSGAAQGFRPALRRGKPAGPLPEDDIPGYSKPGAKATDKDKDKAANAAEEQTPSQLIPAISDSAGPDPRPYTFDWIKGEEDDRRKQITDLAKAQVQAYVTAQAKATTTAKTTTTAKAVPAGAKRAQPKLPDPILSNPQMTAYDLWANNQPVLVFSAEAQMPGAAGTPAAVAGMQYHVLIVAYPDIYNGLRKIYGSVTDKYHLDLTPRLELIDAVDADGDGRGELLFREISDAGTGWAIYRAGADKLWKMYDSLNPE